MTELSEIFDETFGLTPRRRPSAQHLPADCLAKLGPQLCRRFEAFASLGRVSRLAGAMQRVEANWFGRLLAQATRLIGTPLAPWQGHEVPVEVTVEGGARGVAWRRLYRFPGRRPLTVTSVKRTTPDGEVLEMVGGGFAVRLALLGDGDLLRFVGRQYFWCLGPLRLPWPLWLTPGVLIAIHRAVGEADFTFTLAFLHPWFGRTIFQTGRFSEEA